MKLLMNVPKITLTTMRLIKIMLAYFVVLCIPFICTMGVYYYAEKEILNKIEDINYVHIEQLSTALHGEMQMIQNVMFSLDRNYMLNYIGDREEQIEPIYLLSMQEVLSDFLSERQSYLSIFCFFPKNKYVVSNDFISYHYEKYYNNFMNFNNYDYEEFRKYIINQYYKQTILPEIIYSRISVDVEARKYIPIITSVEYGNNDDSTAVVIFLLATQYIEDKVGVLVEGSKTYIGVYKNEQLISLIYDMELENPELTNSIYEVGNNLLEGSIELCGESYRVYEYNFYDMTYRVCLDEESFLKELQMFRNNTLFLLVVTFIFVIMIGISVSVRLNKPVKALFKQFEIHTKDSTATDIYTSISNTFQNMLGTKEKLEEEIIMYSNSLKEREVEKLLRGQPYDFNLLVEVIPREQVYFQVVVLEMYINEGKDAEAMVASKVLDDYFISQTMNSYVVPITIEQRAVIFWSQDGIEESHEKLTLNLESLMDVFPDILFYFGFGNLVNSYDGLKESYEKANEIVYYARLCEDVTIHKEEQREFEVYNYSHIMEMKIISLCKSKSYQVLSRFVNEIFNTNLIDKKLPTSQIRQLISDMRGTVIRCIEITGNGGKEKYISYINLLFEEQISVFDFIELVQEVFEHICSEVEESTKDEIKEKTLEKTKIKQYIDDNFADSEMNLMYLSNKLGINNAKLSIELKETLGMNFSVYLEGKRIQASEKLLIETEYSIEKIAEMVGYNSARVYRRSFFKVHQEKPSEFKKKMRK